MSKPTFIEEVANEYRNRYLKDELRFEKTIKIEPKLIKSKNEDFDGKLEINERIIYYIPYIEYESIFKNLKIKLLKPELKINHVDIMVGGQIIERIEGRFFRVLRNILEVDIQNIPSYLFNEGITTLEFHQIEISINIDGKYESSDIEIYIDQYISSLKLFDFTKKYHSFMNNLPYNEIISPENKLICIISGLIIEDEFEEIELNNKKYKKDKFTKIGNYYYILFDNLIVEEKINFSIENKFWFLSVNNYRTINNMGGKIWSYK